MLFDASGHLAHQTIPMSATHVRALVDGDFFIENGVGALQVLRLEPICSRCLALGHAGAIRLTDAGHQIGFACAHTSGHILKGRKTDCAQLLSTLGWNIRCTDCHETVRGENTRRAAFFTVKCTCTTRLMDNPLAAKAS